MKSQLKKKKTQKLQMIKSVNKNVKTAIIYICTLYVQESRP